MKLKYKIWLDHDGKVFGEGPYQLLMGVKSSGSLAAAAKDLNMSYSRAHGLMKHLARRLGFPLIESQAGGSGGGGTRVTPQAEDLMRRYDAFMQESSEVLERLFAQHFIETAPKDEAPPRQAGRERAASLSSLQLAGHEVISLSGGGGKTSIMYALAEELSQDGAKVLITTTTRILLPGHGLVHRLLLSDEPGIYGQLKQGIKPGEIVVTGGGVREGKLMGLKPEFIDQLAALEAVDYILVEADGAARRPFKAPADYEPVIPQSSTVVLNITGLDILGRPLNNESCHRVEEIAAICGLSIGAALDSRALAAVICSPAGGRKNVPRGAHWLPVINKVDSEKDLPRAREIAEALGQAGATEVLFTSTLSRRLKVVLWNRS